MLASPSCCSQSLCVFLKITLPFYIVGGFLCKEDILQASKVTMWTHVYEMLKNEIKNFFET